MTDFRLMCYNINRKRERRRTVKKCSLNEQLEISYPDSFTPLEKSEIMTDDKTIKAKWGVKDSGGELYIYIGWTGRLGLIGSLFITQRGILRKFEKSCKRFLSDYSRGQCIQKKVFDKSAAGFAFGSTMDSTDCFFSSAGSVFNSIASFSSSKAISSHIFLRFIRISALLAFCSAE